MKILVVSGFLGSGKTTFIKELAKNTKRDFAIMENEYGEVGIDGQLLSEGASDSSEKLNIWELAEGCICCSMKSDFATSVLTIANTVDPEFLIVEPTGVGMLSRVIENISRISYERISLLKPVTVLDIHSYSRYLKEFPEIYKDQITAAGTILLSKIENTDADEIQSVKGSLAAMNPTADIVATPYQKMGIEWWESIISRPYDEKEMPSSDIKAPELENIGLTEISLRSPDELILFLQGVVSGVFGDICRAKGYLQAGKSKLHFEVADRNYTVTAIDGMDDSRAVFIGKNLRRYYLRDVLQKNLKIVPGRRKKRTIK